ncbi:Flavin reductase like domain [Teratosphaeria destructans]|uniref:Flavin reductase like domain n=1 Tax=Teratosphaeria destructans TaxID=418781 RepID=A0A9W7SL63_9PEZI|nr:Flavin reductase like domain [Teratosphaeria destructans]
MSSDQEQRKEDPKPHHEMMADREKAIKRNPHGNFKEVEASRPDWDQQRTFTFTKTVKPDWKPGQGGNDGGESLKKEHIDIDPYQDGRPAAFNYKLLISAIIPRPIGFLSTTSKDGSSTNLAPFSYTQVVNHDPPVFIVGYAGGMSSAKDSLRNLVDTGECTINIISEHFIEAGEIHQIIQIDSLILLIGIMTIANATSVNAPYGVSEWALTGLHPAPSKDVKPSRVKEAIFSVEGKLMNTQEFESRATPGKKTGVLAVIEGVRFWAREDAINEDRNLIDPAVLRPMSRLGGITYGRLLEGIELPRPEWEEFRKDAEPAGLAKPKAEGQ